MRESKDFLTPIEKLKQEIELRYRIKCYEKLHNLYLCNRMEKNNVNIIYKGIEDLTIDLQHSKRPKQ